MFVCLFVLRHNQGTLNCGQRGREIVRLLIWCLPTVCHRYRINRDFFPICRHAYLYFDLALSAAQLSGRLCRAVLQWVCVCLRGETSGESSGDRCEVESYTYSVVFQHTGESEPVSLGRRMSVCHGGTSSHNAYPSLTSFTHLCLIIPRVNRWRVQILYRMVAWLVKECIVFVACDCQCMCWIGWCLLCH